MGERLGLTLLPNYYGKDVETNYFLNLSLSFVLVCASFKFLHIFEDRKPLSRQYSDFMSKQAGLLQSQNP